jgi:tol-pal system protein YbgF
LRRYPTGSYTDIARYWLGNAQYGRRDYKEAINSFRAFVTAAPTHARAPEAMLAMANCQVEMQDTRAARRTLEELVRTYPQSEAAVAGRDRMTAIR